ncbi:MAG: hypothetical protein EOM54_05565 [Clostridia bacterium]|nr:hypothetical protein [Clostridia bacterium]
MKILIAFFSGTGNTYYCAKYLENRLSENGLEVSTRSIESLPKEEIKDYDILVVGFPVYACDMPGMIRDYLNNMPLTTGKKAYLFCTKALSSGNALSKAAGILKAAGYSVPGYADVTMPGSDGLVFLAKDSSASKKMTGRDFSIITPLDQLAEKIESDMKNPADSADELPEKPIRTKVTGVLADGLFKVAYRPVERRMAGKFYADHNCIRCGLCAKICPVQNIKITSIGVFFSNRCFLCMRCINQCPQEAIQIGRGTIGKMRWKGPDNSFDPSK